MPFYPYALGLAAIALSGCSNIAPNNPLKLQHEEERRFRSECRPTDDYNMRTGWSPNKAFNFVCQRTPIERAAEGTKASENTQADK